LSPITKKRHLDCLVCQLECRVRRQKLSNLEAIELFRQLEETEYPYLELVVVHCCEASMS